MNWVIWVFPPAFDLPSMRAFRTLRFAEGEWFLPVSRSVDYNLLGLRGRGRDVSCGGPVGIWKAPGGTVPGTLRNDDGWARR